MLKLKLVFLSVVIFSVTIFAQQDYSKTKTLQMVANAHFDTQWRWTVQTSINEYVANTLKKNFYLLEKYPFYVFNFEGGIKYMWMKEYYPADYDTLKKYIAAGRWNICGSSLDAGDANIPSPEAVIRNILVGQQFYKKEFGKTSFDIFMPDCFGFGYAFPTIAKHCGLKGFSTQKLTWGSAFGIPFDMGIWEGVDGSRVVTVMNAEDYTYKIKSDMSNDTSMIRKINAMGEKTGQYIGYKYYGVGDRGGAPTEESVQWLGKSIEGQGPLKVMAAPADLYCRELTPAKTAKFPVYKGELLMTYHGAGCYTSQSAMKRWNRKNEQLADAAERASVMADWFGSAKYPKQRLNDAWTRFLWHQFHDDLTGTSIFEAYDFSWNDEIIAMNQFASILEDAAGGVIRALETHGTGTPVAVYNPLSFDREDVVEATISKEAKYIKVLDPSFKEVPSQIIRNLNGKTTILFSAKVPSCGFAVYDVQTFEYDPETTLKNTLSASNETIENKRYKVSVDANGDVSSVYDKINKKELLSSPIRMQMLNDTSSVYPAWEILYNTVTAAPRGFVDEKVKVTVLEQGPVRASLKISREKDGSTFVQIIRLGVNSNRVEFENEVNWRTRGTLLKAAFPLSVSNAKATYDLGCGTIQRGNNIERLYEVPAQQWADITDAKNSYGVSVLNDCKYGWDKPTDNTLRLTLLHTPKTMGGYKDQEVIDIGRHRFSYAVCGHTGDWRNRSIQEAACLNQPLCAFEPKPFEGNMGRSISFADLNSDQVIIRAMKKAENSNEIVIRMQELYGKEALNVKVKFPMRILTARELNGAEEEISKVILKDTVLIANFKPYQPRTFAITLAPSLEIVSPPSSIDLGLDYNIDVVSSDSNRLDGNIIDGKTLPMEQFPSIIDFKGIRFKLGLKEDDHMNAMTCKGDKITLPNIQYRSFYFLAASRKGDIASSFKIDGKTYPVYIQSMFENIGQWDKPNWYSSSVNGEKIEFFNIDNSFIKRENIAWYSSHLHNGYLNINEAYKFGYMFCYKIDLPDNAKELILPNDENIIIFAVTMGKNYNEWVHPAHDLYDRADVMSPVRYTTSSNGNTFDDKVAVTLFTQRTDQTIHYTTDGSTPDENSPKYTSVLTFDKTTVLKAKAFLPGNETGYEICIPLFKGTCMPAILYDKIVPGLEMSYYEGEWKNLPLFDTMTPKNIYAIDGFHIAKEDQGKDNFAYRFKGYIKVPADGMYVFTLATDDGSSLFIDGKNIILVDGIHGPEDMTGSVMLKKGLHEIRMDYFEAGGGEEINFYMEGPGMKKQSVPPSMLFRKKVAE